MHDLRTRLLSKKRRVSHSVVVEFPDGTQSVDLIRPTVGDRAKLIDRARRDGLVGEDGAPTSQLNGLLLLARIVIMLTYVEGAPIFLESDAEDVMSAAFFDVLSAEAQKVFAPDPEAVEKH